MDEILNKLLESDLLNEESRLAITEAYNTAVEGLREEVRKELEVQVRGELVEEWVQQREKLIEAVDTSLNELVSKELIELKDDIDSFRDLEAEYASRIVEEKHRLANLLAEEIDKLVGDVDTFLDKYISMEMTELKEDLEEIRKNEFGRKIYETFHSEFNKSFVDDESVQAQLKITEDKLRDAEDRLKKIDEDAVAAVRTAKLDELLGNLSGKKREKMAYLLKSVATDRLDELYSFFIPKVIRDEAVAEPEKKVVTEEVKTTTDNKETTVVTGDEKTVVTETVKTETISPETARWLKIAGVNNQ